MLTLEHVPPESAGGKHIALTCRDCNSTAGHTVDADRHGREKFIALTKGLRGMGSEFEGSATLTIDGVPTNARLILRDRTFTIEVHEQQNNPAHFSAQQAALHERKRLGSLDAANLLVNARVKFNFERSRVSELRAAFLACFAQFGYRYAYNRRLELVRQQIRHPDTAVIDGAWWFADAQFVEDPMMIVTTAPFPAVFVRLGPVLVVLPWLSGPPDLYVQVRSHFEQRPSSLKGDVLEWPTTMRMLADFDGQPPRLAPRES